MMLRTRKPQIKGCTHDRTYIPRRLATRRLAANADDTGGRLGTSSRPLVMVLDEEKINLRETQPLGSPRKQGAPGFRCAYRDGEPNLCPDCGMSQWLVGRVTVECACCGTVLSLEHTGMEGRSTASNFWRRDMMRRGHFDGYTHRSDWDDEATWEV